MPSRNARPFNYCFAVRDLCADVCRKLPEFRSVDLKYVGFSAARSKPATRVQLWAYLTPLRFEGGRLAECRTITRRRLNPATGRLETFTQEQYYACQRALAVDGVTELLYILTILTPRFYELSVMQKLETIIHELYHISPAFNGDVRRFPGRNWQHGSKDAYRAKCQKLAKDWLATEPNPALYDFLQYDSKGLSERFPGMILSKYNRIKVVPVTKERALELEPSLAKNRK